VCSALARLGPMTERAYPPDGRATIFFVADMNERSFKSYPSLVDCQAEDVG